MSRHTMLEKPSHEQLMAGIRELDKIFKREHISYSIIGAMALDAHGFWRSTKDIDTVIDLGDIQTEEDLEIFEKKYFYRSKDAKGKEWLVLKNSNVAVDLLPSGERLRSGTEFAHPSEISELRNGIPYLTLKSLVYYKLSSGRRPERERDNGDIQELIKIGDLPETYADDFDSDLKEKYRSLWKKTHQEEPEDISGIDKILERIQRLRDRI